MEFKIRVFMHETTTYILIVLCYVMKYRGSIRGPTHTWLQLSKRRASPPSLPPHAYVWHMCQNAHTTTPWARLEEKVLRGFIASGWNNWDTLGIGG